MSDKKYVITVVGAGRMGTGIAQVFAYAGHGVRLVDAKERSSEEAHEVLAAASEEIARNISFLAALELFDASISERILHRISYFDVKQLDEALSGAEVVFEAVPELMEVKQTIYASISRAVGDDTIIASTTSTFLVDTLASYVDGPQRFMNTHWLNPAYLIPLVEVSPSQDTAAASLEKMLALLQQAGKVPVECSASPGFIVPRIQALAMNEAVRMVEEGVARPEDIDRASRLGLGFRFVVLGLLEFVDWGGGDILYYASNYLKDELGEERFAPPDIITRNMEKGNIGLKSGEGFYNYHKSDVTSYQKEVIKKLIDLLQHLGLFTPPKA